MGDKILVDDNAEVCGSLGSQELNKAVAGRARVLGEFRVKVVPAREELVIAEAVGRLLA